MIKLYCTYTGANRFLRSIIVENVGIIKEIDRLGRIVIPKEYRERLGLNKTVELVLVKDGVLIRSSEYQLIRTEKQEENGNYN